MTPIELLVPVLLRAEAVAGVGVLAVLALRRPARDLFGAELAYRLWLLPLVLAIASFFPTLKEFLANEAPAPGLIDWTGAQRLAVPIAIAWLAGMLTMALLMVLSEWRFKRLVRRGRAGPAVIGVAWPQLVVPNGYREQFTPGERALILEHERVHMARRDPKANLLIAVLLAIGWFNPLMHLAARLARLDQELACDAVVIERRPKQRRAYAEALLKAQGHAARSPIACFWACFWGPHPLELRIRLLARRRIGLGRYTLGAAAISALCVVCAGLLWGLAPI